MPDELSKVIQDFIRPTKETMDEREYRKMIVECNADKLLWGEIGDKIDDYISIMFNPIIFKDKESIEKLYNENIASIMFPDKKDDYKKYEFNEIYWLIHSISQYDISITYDDNIGHLIYMVSCYTIRDFAEWIFDNRD